MHKQCKSHAHFEGKEAILHVIEARKKGAVASDEIHGAEMPGHVSAFTDAAKETSFLLIVLWTILETLGATLSNLHWILAVFAIGWTLWKTGRSALLGYARLERMHRVIEEERYEIEHHRPQEKEELRALYQAKGFSGRLLDEVVDVLMADDNRLLEVMLHEELGFKLEANEHPLKQAFGALLGALASFAIIAVPLFLLPPIATLLTAALLIGLSAAFASHLEKNRPLPSIIWNLGVAALASGATYFALQLLLRS